MRALPARIARYAGQRTCETWGPLRCEQVLAVVTHLARNPGESWSSHAVATLTAERCAAEDSGQEAVRVLQVQELNNFLAKARSQPHFKDAAGSSNASAPAFPLRHSRMPCHSVLVIGDFNAVPSSDSVKTMLNDKWKEAFMSTHGGSISPGRYTTVTTARRDYIGGLRLGSSSTDRLELPAPPPSLPPGPAPACGCWVQSSPWLQTTTFIRAVSRQSLLRWRKTDT